MVKSGGREAERFISYSINGEDVILNRVFAGQARGFYVDVGAAHPTWDNDTRALYDRGWHGLNVEPNDDFFAVLASERLRDINLHLALSDEDGTISYWEVAGTGLSTCDIEEAARARAKGWGVIEHKTECTTLGKVLADADPSDIDLLKVDVEGFELRVLQGNDWTRFRPRLVIVEATLPETSERRLDRVRPFLAQNGYDFAYFDGLNDFFVERSFSPPEGSFRPISVFDRVDRYELVELRKRARQLERERDEQAVLIPPLKQRIAEAGEQLERVRSDLYRMTQSALATEAQASRHRAAAAQSLQEVAQAGERLMSMRRQLVVAAAEIAEGAARRKERDGEMERLLAEHDEARRMLAAIAASTSWAITRPVRGGARLLRKLAPWKNTR